MIKIICILLFLLSISSCSDSKYEKLCQNNGGFIKSQVFFDKKAVILSVFSGKFFYFRYGKRYLYGLEFFDNSHYDRLSDVEKKLPRSDVPYWIAEIVASGDLVYCNNGNKFSILKQFVIQKSKTINQIELDDIQSSIVPTEVN